MFFCHTNLHEQKINIREFIVVITLIYVYKHRIRECNVIHLYNPCFYTKYINMYRLKVYIHFIDKLTLNSQIFCLYIYMCVIPTINSHILIFLRTSVYTKNTNESTASVYLKLKNVF